MNEGNPTAVPRIKIAKRRVKKRNKNESFVPLLISSLESLFDIKFAAVATTRNATIIRRSITI